MKQTFSLALFAMALAMLDGTAVWAADAYHGEQLALRWCSDCHLVAADQRRATTEAPAFETIANRPNFDAARLAFFLLDPHPKMPNMSLTRIEAADIAAYVGSLAK
jgi:mono/diheme cytochrome c family protein